MCKDKRIEMHFDPQCTLTMFEPSHELVAFEVPKKEKGTYLVELSLQQTRSSYLMWSAQVPLAQSRFIALRPEMTEKDVKLEVFRMLRPLIRAPDIAQQISNNETDAQILEMEYNSQFELDARNPLYSL